MTSGQFLLHSSRRLKPSFLIEPRSVIVIAIPISMRLSLRVCQNGKLSRMEWSEHQDIGHSDPRVE